VTDYARGVGDTSASRLLEALPDPVLVINRDLRILYANRKSETALGVTAAELIGEPIEVIIPERLRDRLTDHLHLYLSDSQSVSALSELDLPVQRENGDEFPAVIRASTFEGEGNDWILVHVRDITRHKLIESELRTSQGLLDAAQRVARLGSWRWDVEHDTVTWSNELHRIFGVPDSDVPITYSTFIDLIHPADRERVENTIIETANTGGTFEKEFRIVRPDGVMRLICCQGVAARDHAGDLVSMTGTAQDVTERKASEAQAFQLALEQTARQEAEHTKSRFQFLAELSEAMGASLDLDQTLSALMIQVVPAIADWCTINVLDNNGRIRRLVGLHRDRGKQHVLDSIRGYCLRMLPDGENPLAAILEKEQPVIYTDVTDEMLEQMLPDDENLDLVRALNPTSVMIVPLKARGRAFGLATFGLSESARRYGDDDLQLASEIAHRAAVSIDNAHLYQEAQDAAVDREQFVSLVSHELKTPLTVIKGYMQVMERYLQQEEWDRERILTTRERLSSQVERLELLVSDILDVSRIQRGRLGLSLEENMDIVALAQQILARFDDAIERKPDHQLRLVADGAILGCWDPLRLDQALSNLVSNALKYSPDGGDIELRIRALGGNAIIEISDSGVGISNDERERLFQPFQRGAASSRGTSGTGLGLYITRQIIEQHGGKIQVDSELGAGSTFTITLPLQPVILEQPDSETTRN
jgi:PAS domain S-box-containing protein